MKSNEYEEIVEPIVRSIFAAAEGEKSLQVKYGKKNLWLGCSGHCHQIDVSVCNSQNILLVECKYWKKKIPVEKVLAFFGRISDISPRCDRKIHSIIVTTVGLQKGAYLIAKHFNIDLSEVQSPFEFALKYKNYFMIARQDSIKIDESVGVKIQ